MVKKICFDSLPTGYCHAFDSPANPLLIQHLADNCEVSTRETIHSLCQTGTLSKIELLFGFYQNATLIT